MKTPECNCFKGKDARGEGLSMQIARETGHMFKLIASNQGVCRDAVMHVALTTAIVILDFAAYAALDEIPNFTCPEDSMRHSESLFEKQALTLLADMRQRRAEMDAQLAKSDGVTLQ